MGVRLVLRRDAVEGLFSRLRGARPRRVLDRLWYRNACAVSCYPFAALASSGRAVFLWAPGDGSWSELWGGEYFAEGDEIDFSDEEAEGFLKIVPLPFTAQLLAKKPADAFRPMGYETNRRNVLRVVWKTWEEYEAWAWDGRQRRKLASELRQYRGFRVDVVRSFSVRDYFWILDRSVDVAARLGQRPPLVVPSRRASMFNVFRAAERTGCFRAIRVTDGGRLVAAEVFLADAGTSEKEIVSFAGYADPSYSGLGKLLYEVLIRYSIENGYGLVNVGNGNQQIKRLFRFGGEKSWEIVKE